LTLARELLAQERFADAEAACKKVFTLDAEHPGAKTLLKQIRDQIQQSLKDAASQLGGMTVKLSTPQAMAAAAKLKAASSGQPHPRKPEEAFEASEPEPFAGFAQDGGGPAHAPDQDLPDSPSMGDATAAEESPFELAGVGLGDVGASVPPGPEPEVFEAK